MSWPILVKHAAAAPAPGDGVRVLVERRWPPGLKRDDLHADLWLKDLAPSDSLLRWRCAAPGREATFIQRYRGELRANEDLRVLAELHARGPVTLLHNTREPAGSVAWLLARLLAEHDSAQQERAS
ncbi:MAG TPA: DUF488 family protein [Usitatibacter sp.]|nr:DUF488 family protein [Usitatibacter sp.]